MQVKVTRVSKKDTDKNGIQLISKKYGKPYFNIGIQVEGDEAWYTTFANSKMEPAYNIEEGGTYHISVTEKHNPNGGVYKNFKMLTSEEVQAEADRAELEELRKLKASRTETVSTSTQTAHTESHVTLDDVANAGKF